MQARMDWRDLIESLHFVWAHYNQHILFQEDDEDLDNKLKSKWDVEDLDDTDVKDSREEEDEPAPALKTEPMLTEKAPKKTVAKTVEKKGNSFEAVKEAPLDPVEEKLGQQRLVEEPDYKSTAELFGKMGDEKTLDNFIPKSKSDFTEYAELVAHKLRPYEKSYHYIGLLKAVMRLSMVSLKGSDAKDVFSCLNDDMIIRPYEDEPVTSFLKKDNKRESTWDDADMDDRFIWPVEPDFASDEELIVPNSKLMSIQIVK
ncbi:hypothetical protein CASFOL_031753 [Castilleja foliolosa]|uniref:Eukaryotic translation initiation factor 3 30 kDa subunit n=1 Tax=Castilleja foliolosa TaxID=1961234 RepID=A0ABD3C5K7_9LAMI